MKVGIIGEGDTEYYCLPPLVANLSHVVVGVRNLGGVGEEFEWEALFDRRIYPYVRSFAKSAAPPERVLIVLDRERRMECCGKLAEKGIEIVQRKLRVEQLRLPVSVVLANRQIESWLLAMPDLLDNSPRFKRPLSSVIGSTTDEKNILALIKAELRPGKGWDKVRDGKALAQRIDLTNPVVLKRSRSLRKFVKELGGA